MRRADELLLAAGERDDGLPLCRIDHAARPKATDAHGRELIEEMPLIGIGTALSDNPQLTCRLSGMAVRSPVRFWKQDCQFGLSFLTSPRATAGR